MNLHSFSFNPFQENTYLVWDDAKQCAVIDPGCYDQWERDELDDFIKKMGLTPIKLLNTHCHVDHVLGNRHVAQRYGLKLEMHRDDLPVLQAVPSYARNFGFETGEMVTPSVFLNDGDTVEVGELKLKVIHVPGHSPEASVFTIMRAHRS
jgi:hydroxyacylglutathione hydrolase